MGERKEDAEEGRKDREVLQDGGCVGRVRGVRALRGSFAVVRKGVGKKKGEEVAVKIVKRYAETHG